MKLVRHGPPATCSCIAIVPGSIRPDKSDKQAAVSFSGATEISLHSSTSWKKRLKESPEMNRSQIHPRIGAQHESLCLSGAFGGS